MSRRRQRLKRQHAPRASWRDHVIGEEPRRRARCSPGSRRGRAGSCRTASGRDHLAGVVSGREPHPHVNERSHVPKVDGANGSNGSTAPAEPARSLLASSMNEPPTSSAATDSALAPEPRPDPGGRTAASISASSPRRSITVPASNSPASATKDPSSKRTSNPSIPPDTLPTGSASSRGRNDRYCKQHSPMSGGLSGGRANPTALTAPVDPLRGRANRRANPPHTGEAVARAARERSEQEREAQRCTARRPHLFARTLVGRIGLRPPAPGPIALDSPPWPR